MGKAIQQSNKFGQWNVVLVLYVFVTLIGKLLPNNITNPTLQYDPALLFLIAKGILPSDPPFAPTGTFCKSILLSLQHTVDPFGFTFILRLWTSISSHIVWIRLLPFLFMVSGIAGFGLLAFQLTQDLYLSAMLALIPLTNHWILHWGFDPRAYSMEICGTFFLCWLCYQNNRFIKKHLIKTLLVLLFFSGSRYSFLVSLFAFAISIFLSQLAFKTETKNNSIKSRTKKRIQYVGYVIFLFILFISVLFPFSKHIHLNVGVISSSVFYGSTWPHICRIFKENFLETATCMQEAFVFIYLFLQKSDKEKQKHFNFFIFLITIHMTLILTSSLGIYPWDMTIRHCNFLIPVAFTSVAALVQILKSKHVIQKQVPPVMFVMAAICCYLLTPGRKFNSASQTLEAVQLIQSDIKQDSILLSSLTQLEARYLFEYGVLKGSPLYPDRILPIYEYNSIPTEQQLQLSRYVIANKYEDAMQSFLKSRKDFHSLPDTFPNLTIYKRNE